MANQYKKLAQEILDLADIKINGTRPWDIQVHNENVYKRVLRGGSLALGESYMDGWWDAKRLDEFFYKLFKVDISKKVRKDLRLSMRILLAAANQRLFNLQSKEKSLEVAVKHYDLGNDLYEKMLDKRMLYTCGYWEDAKNLDDAQKAKMDLVCRKLNLKPGMKILDTGCGFGSFAKYATENYGVKAVGVSISKEQIEYGKKMCAGLPVDLQLRDYRDVKGEYDAVVSIGLLEHVGRKNYRSYMQIVHKHLKKDGMLLLHTIGSNGAYGKEAWLNKYIFPGGELAGIGAVGKAIENLFVMEDWHNFGADYDKTLMAWFNNFDKNWKTLENKYDKSFYRMWKYYLLACAGNFRARNMQLWQIVLSKNGVPGGYESLR